MNPPSPSRLPAAHFVVGLLFLAAGLAGLVPVAGDLARGAILGPRVAAVAHLFTLGWLTTVIYGALGLFMPHATGAPPWPAPVRGVALALHGAGTAAMAGGLTWHLRPLLYGGVAAVGAAVLLVAGLVARSAFRGRGDRRIRITLVAAVLFLVVAFGLGAALAGNLHQGFFGTDRLRVAGIHLHVAALGWVLLVILAAGRRIFVMFLLAHSAPTVWWDRSALLVGSGMGLLVAGAHGAGEGVVGVAAALTWLGVLAFVVQVARVVRHRGRPLDPGMALAVGGVAVTALALLPSLAWMAGSEHPRLGAVWVTALLLGGFTPFVLGHARKMLPFQLWSLRHAREGGRDLPPMDALLSVRVGWSACVLAGPGILLLLAGLAAGSVPLARGGAFALATGLGIVVGELVWCAVRHRPRGTVRAEPSPAHLPVAR